MANIILVDDHEIVTDSLKFLIENQSTHLVISKQNNAESAIEYLNINYRNVDLVISDIKLPEKSGLDLAKEVKRLKPNIKVILLSQYSNKEYVSNGLKNGIDGYLIKSTGVNDLLKAISAVLNGKQYLCRESSQMMALAKFEPNSELSERELEILKLIAEGVKGKNIADRLNIHIATVDYHKKNLRLKLGVTSTTDLARIAFKMGIID
jgi:DNA-binding NarL/FixJ family response regulator